MHLQIAHSLLLDLLQNKKTSTIEVWYIRKKEPYY